MRLLVTRPEPNGERTAAKLRARGHAVELASLLRIEPIGDAELGPPPFAAVLTTSPNAARAILSHARIAELCALPAFAVGRRTAEAMRAGGFRKVMSADGNQTDLVRLLRARFAAAPPGEPFLYLAGEDRSGDLAGELAAIGVAVRTVVVYRAVAAAAFPGVVRDALVAGRLDGVLHYSRRSAEAFLHCAAAGEMLEAARRLTHYCLSRQVAEPLIGAGAGAIRVAQRPEETALIELVNATMIRSDDGSLDQAADDG